MVSCTLPALRFFRTLLDWHVGSSVARPSEFRIEIYRMQFHSSSRQYKSRNVDMFPQSVPGLVRRPSFI